MADKLSAVTFGAAKSYADSILGGGGVTSIIAGNGITVNPASGQGDVTVSATAQASGRIWVGTYSGLFSSGSGLGLQNPGQWNTQNNPSLGDILNDDLTALVPWQIGFYAIDNSDSLGVVLNLVKNEIGQVTQATIMLIAPGSGR
ncbi:hypothetical protein FACS1894217_13240 [Clostridia bacterium]|nr:hypothetical protein FACS1894217_13240 [Clostridia bacterium]